MQDGLASSDLFVATIHRRSWSSITDRNIQCGLLPSPLSLDSREKIGSNFTFTLRLEKDPDVLERHLMTILSPLLYHTAALLCLFFFILSTALPFHSSSLHIHLEIR